MFRWEPAPGAIEPQRALHCQPVEGPLVLRVEGVILRPVTLLPRRDANHGLIHPRHDEAEVSQGVTGIVGQIRRSTYGFCHGLCRAETTSTMLMPASRR